MKISKGLVSEALRSVGENPNAAVSWWLILSKAYYVDGLTLVPDAIFDSINRSLLENYDEITHAHKHLISKEALGAYSGFNIPREKYPRVVNNSLIDLLKDYHKEIIDDPIPSNPG